MDTRRSWTTVEEDSISENESLASHDNVPEDFDTNTARQPEDHPDELRYV